MTFQLTSSAFHEGQMIPSEFTGDGADLSPPLAWADPPNSTVSFALIVDDPDAPRRTFVHWVLFNLPGELRALREGVEAMKTLPNGTRQGKNDFGATGYGGPAPPKGKPRRYVFRLYALNVFLAVPAGATKTQLLEAIKGHVMGVTQLLGKYQR